MVLVDWAQACRAAAWVDLVLLLPSVGLHGGYDLEAILSGSPASSAPTEDVTAVLVALTGYFLWRATRPPPPGLPTVRAFQRAQGDVALRWLQTRLDS